MAPLLLNNALLLIKPRNQCNHTTIVVVYINGSVACKQLHLHDHTAALVSANPNYAPIIVTEEMVILGRAIKIERNVVEDRQS